MTTRLVVGAAAAAAVGNGLVGGTFLAFSSFIMPALARVAPLHGIASMQSINLAVVPSGFMAVFVGSTLLSSALAVTACARRTPHAALLAVAGAASLAAFGITLACNVPLNDALARQSGDAAGADGWRDFLAAWPFWNTARGAASTAAACLFTLWTSLPALRGGS